MSANKNEGKTNEKPKISKEKLHKNGFIFRYLIPYRVQFILGLLVLSAGSILFLVIMKLPGEVFNILDKNPIYPMNLNQLFLSILRVFKTNYYSCRRYFLYYFCHAPPCINYVGYFSFSGFCCYVFW
jgi:hypothetical protein